MANDINALVRELDKSFRTVEKNFHEVQMQLEAVTHALAAVLANLDAVADLDADAIARDIQADPRSVAPGQRGDYRRLATAVVHDIVARAQAQRNGPATDEDHPAPDNSD